MYPCEVNGFDELSVVSKVVSTVVTIVVVASVITHGSGETADFTVVDVATETGTVDNTEDAVVAGIKASKETKDTTDDYKKFKFYGDYKTETTVIV